VNVRLELDDELEDDWIAALELDDELLLVNVSDDDELELLD